MSLQYIRDYYKVPAKRGCKVKYNGDGRGRVGRITSAEGNRIRVSFDGTRMRYILHPTWKIDYLK